MVAILTLRVLGNTYVKESWRREDRQGPQEKMGKD